MGDTAGGTPVGIVVNNNTGGSGFAGGGLLTSQTQTAGGGPVSASGLSFNNVFQQMGQIGTIVNFVNDFRGQILPAQTNVLALIYDLVGGQPLVDGLYSQLAGSQSSAGGFLGGLSQLATQTIIQNVNAVFPLANQNLTTAMASLILAMNASGQTVFPNTITTLSLPTFSNNGNGKLAITKKLVSGRVAENSYPETLACLVVKDGQPGGGATTGSEVMSIMGQQSVSDPLSWLWPGGSGANLQITAINSALNNVGGFGNWLYNSAFNFWQNNTPSGWRVAIGTPGTTIVQGTNTFGAGTVMNFVGNGSELTSVYQIIGVDTTTNLSPLQLLMSNIWLSLSTIPASGELEISLLTPAGAVSTDNSGNLNHFKIDLTRGISPYGAVPYGVGGYGLNQGYGAYGNTSYGLLPYGAFIGSPFSAFTGEFATPQSLISGNYSLAVRLSKPLSSGCTLSIDGIALTKPTSLYQQGPSVAWFSGGFPAIINDSYQLIVENNFQGEMQTLFQRLFNMMQLQMLLPTSGTPSQGNNWIQPLPNTLGTLLVA